MGHCTGDVTVAGYFYCKDVVAGSSPVAHFGACSSIGRARKYLHGTFSPVFADVAQLVARHLAKVKVAGSNPVIRSWNAVRLTT